MTRKTATTNKSPFILHTSYFIIFLSLAILVIPAASPYFIPDSVPRTNDLFPHLYRTFALESALTWHTGLWPRWSPELVHGYGYPVFNFFPAGSHFLLLAIHKLGFTLPTAYRILIYLHFYISALTSYTLGRELSRSRTAAFLAAATYVYTPYILYDAHIRGSIPESQALALLPLLILGLHKLVNQSFSFSVFQLFRRSVSQPPSTQPPALSTQHSALSTQHSAPSTKSKTLWLPLTALIFATILLSHYPILFQLCFPIGLWLLLSALSTQHSTPSTPLSTLYSLLSTLTPPALALLLGALLTTFFTLPTLFEVSATQADLSISQGYTYESNFSTFSELLDWPDFPADPALVNPPVVRPLPLVALTFALFFALVNWRKFTSATKRQLTIWTAVLIIATFLITPASAPVWANFPLLQLTLYPWRLSGMIALIAAILIALAYQPNTQHSALSTQHPHPLHSLLSTLYCILLLASATPWLFLPQEPIPTTITQATVTNFEIPPFFIGTTTLGEFLPATVQALPDTAAQKEALTNGQNPDRLQRPTGITATQTNDNPLNAHYTLNLTEPTRFTYNQFAFPGWQVTTNGRSIETTPSDPHGLLTFTLPQGQHDLQITFTQTPIRRIGTAISALALLTTITLLISPLATQHPALSTQHSAPSTQHPALSTQHSAPSTQHATPLYSLLSTLLPTLTILITYLLIVTLPTPLHQPTLQPNGILNKPHITPLDYAGELRLLTYEQSADQIRSDQPIKLTLYWQPQRGIGVDYAVGVQIVDAQGNVWSKADTTRPNDWRFVAGEDPWPLDSYRMDPFILTLLDGAPPQEYQFLVGLVRRDTGQTVAAHTLGRLQVTAPANHTNPLEDGLTSHNTTSAEALTLLGSRTDRTEARPGDPIRLTTLWQAAETTSTSAPNSYLLQLISDSGDLLLERREPIATLPPNQWQAADRFRSAPTFRLPADLPSGAHTWQATYNNQTTLLHPLTITAPTRTYTPPTPATPLNVQFSDLVTLLGADSSLTIDNRQLTIDNSSPLTITLYWQPNSPTSTSYRIFLHLLDPTGQIIAQSDGEPAQWARPTTGWLPDEIITDPHTLNLPPDLPTAPYTLITGLYDPATGRRLTTPDGTDTATILTIAE